jgi:hypothetical protein
MRRVLDFKDLYEEVKRVADEKFEGNFSMAARFLIGEGLKYAG